LVLVINGLLRKLRIEKRGDNRRIGIMRFLSVEFVVCFSERKVEEK